MYRIILYIVLVSTGTILSAGVCRAILVDGYCYLENQTDHSGSKVLFQADSPTAVTDSTYTDSSGYYQADLQIGIYDITYSHQGYYDYSLPDQLITTQTTLPAVTLESLPPYIPLSGYISGVLTDTLYLVVGEVVVDIDDSLIIEPGAVILFDGAYVFAVSGYLYAVGTEEDSIVFASREGAEPWITINLVYFTMHATLKYCYVTGSCFGGIGIILGEATIENCLIEGNYSEYGMGGLGVSYSSQPVIRNCDIIDNTSDYGAGGIYCGSIGDPHPIFENCRIEGNSSTNSAGGVRCDEEAYPEFIDCIINNNGPNGGVVCLEESHPTFTNCTITDNWGYGAGGDGINILEDSYPTVTNTIVAGNSDAGINFNGSLNTLVSYCDIYGNRVDITGSAIPPFLGEIVTANINGDSCDIYHNIFLDPLFYSTTGDSAFFLTENSPCIDAGDPESPLDPDFTIADMGAYYYHQTVGIEDQPGSEIPQQFALFPNYPNPFNPTTQIHFALPKQSTVKIAVYDLLGRQAAVPAEGSFPPGYHTVIWEASGNSSGVYFIRK